MIALAAAGPLTAASSLALPDLLDPMYWLGADGVFRHAVLPGILLIVFIETGLLFPLLPGESLLFTGGLLTASAHPPVSIGVLASCVAVVAVLGDQSGYLIGRRIGPALFKKEDSRLFKQHYVTQSHAFFAKYGPVTIILARFAPIVRTFVPVVAGVSYMRYPVFLGFDIIGGVAWGAGATLLGYFLGTVAFVNENLELIVWCILFVSLLPALTSAGRAYLKRRRAPKAEQLPVPE
ncbi:VTT domain-containing protein [Mycobacterium sp. SM1]|uniref:VTT domain-containing protein n=1 Tax=Mycobacterium sp. SM1 TaxID=2816243 RepID=UPI001BCB7C91|nr:VTT domain-containing protein [Mycobacterium sp. SM1]MBS4728425.1 VTT domain-containing protein [Mycobacterium sp. SM1]